MSFINKILQFFLSVSIVLLVFVLSITSTLSSSQKLTVVLDSSGFYQALSTGLATQLKNQVIERGNDAALVKKSIDLAITPDLVKGLMQPTQIAFVSWLSQSSSSLDVKLDLSTTKDKISSKADTSGVRFEIAKIIPDNIELVANNGSSGSSALSSLEKLKYFYQLMLQAIPILWAVAFISTSLLFVFNLRKGSKKLSRIMTAVTTAGIIGLAICLLSRLLSSSVKLGQFDSFSVVDLALIVRLIVAIASETLLVFSIIAGFGLLGILIAKVVFRASDKKIKHNKK